MQLVRFSDARFDAFIRVALSYYVTSGLIAAVGLFVISAAVGFVFGSVAAATAGIAVIVVVPPDLPAPRRGKLWQLLPAVAIAPPLFFAARFLHADPWRLAMLLVPATFVAFLGAAWGRRGIPVSMSAMFALVFGMAVPAAAAADSPLRSTAYFALGAVSYLGYAIVANSLLNARFRVQILADTLLSMASLMRTQGQQLVTGAGSDTASSPVGRLLREQAALADQLQGARDILLEAPRTPSRQRLAGMLVKVLEIRDQLLACELDIDHLRADAAHVPLLSGLRSTLGEHGAQLEALADCLLLGRDPAPFDSVREHLDHQSRAAELTAADMLARGLVARVANISDELAQMNALARHAAEPELAVVRASWQMFISPAHWSWQPVKGLWRWDAPPLRHALRAASAIGTAYAVSRVVPWPAHAYWILLTIVVVLRGSLAQTLERRNNRVAGTLVGSVIAGLLLAARTPTALLMAIATVAQGVAHAFAIKRYLVTAIAATVLALLQVHLLNSGLSVAFDAFERIADTLIGVAVAWGFCYVLPAWERTQIPALIERALQAQARHSHASLELGQLTAVDNRPELEWRLARREAYDQLIGARASGSTLPGRTARRQAFRSSRLGVCSLTVINCWPSSRRSKPCSHCVVATSLRNS